jgi:hypothetical protein
VTWPGELVISRGTHCWCVLNEQGGRRQTRRPNEAGAGAVMHPNQKHPSSSHLAGDGLEDAVAVEPQQGKHVIDVLPPVKAVLPRERRGEKAV